MILSYFLSLYLNIARLQAQILAAGIVMRRKAYDSIHDLISDFPRAGAYFNCSGLGSYSLKGVEDHNLYPSRVRFCFFSPQSIFFHILFQMFRC